MQKSLREHTRVNVSAREPPRAHEDTESTQKTLKVQESRPDHRERTRDTESARASPRSQESYRERMSVANNAREFKEGRDRQFELPSIVLALRFILTEMKVRTNT